MRNDDQYQNPLEWRRGNGLEVGQGKILNATYKFKQKTHRIKINPDKQSPGHLSEFRHSLPERTLRYQIRWVPNDCHCRWHQCGNSPVIHDETRKPEIRNCRHSLSMNRLLCQGEEVAMCTIAVIVYYEPLVRYNITWDAGSLVLVPDRLPRMSDRNPH